jgi:periplasmic protein CpxP/Spy
MKNYSKILSAFAVSITLCILSGDAFAADATPAVSASAPMSTAMARNHGPESRIRHLHDQLKIMPNQEVQWMSVSQVMLDNASAIESAVKDRVAMTKGMTAVDDLRSYQTIAEAHADGIKKLAAAFAPLYAAMPEAQQKNADAVFAHRTAPAKSKTHA